MESCWRRGCVVEAPGPGAALNSAATPDHASEAAAARALDQPEGGRRGQPPGDPVAPGLPSRSDNLVIGIGNALRGDDGVGGWLAQRAEQWLPAVQLRTVQQLTPELAEDMAAAARVLFIDAWLVPGGRGMEPGCEQGGHRAGAGQSAWGAEIAGCNDQTLMATLGPAGEEEDGLEMPLGAFSHQLSPRQLLRITALLYGGRPEAWQLLVPIFCLDHGEGFSQRLTQLLPGAETLLRRWIHCGDAVSKAGRA